MNYDPEKLERRTPLAAVADWRGSAGAQHMQDMRALKNSRNLNSWRTWQGAAYRRSGFSAILVAVPTLSVAFVLACTLYGRALGRHIEVPVVLTGLGFYSATVLGLMAFAMLRLKAWKRANPWTPPS
jgi:hypothetical protein